MGNEKDLDSRVQSIENMVVVMAFLVPKRSAVMEGLGKFLRKPGCQFETCFTSVVQIGVKEPEHYH